MEGGVWGVCVSGGVWGVCVCGGGGEGEQGGVHVEAWRNLCAGGWWWLCGWVGC